MILLIAVKVEGDKAVKWLDFSDGWDNNAKNFLQYGAECEADEDNDWWHVAYDTEREIFL